MCGICGCGQAEVAPADGRTAAGIQSHEHDAVHDHGDGAGPHAHPHPHHDHDPGRRPGGDAPDHGHAAHAPGVSAERLIRIEQDILSKNDAFARQNRSVFSARRLFALNVVSSPGSGKTTLLVKTIAALKARTPVAVIEGDQQTSNDAERIRATGAPAIQINTGRGCHLDAHMVGHALETLRPEAGAVLFIENVGNLVCPAAFDLGEARRVVVLSVTEGEDKPLKYPDMFVSADLMLLNKADLLPHLDFDVGLCLANALRINPNLQTLTVSARTGEGIAAFVAWIEASAARHVAALARA
ncbi:hydrogenase nickel incorporation protein HypB [Roseiarcus fermentans]|uniref:Hydrogenase maturation factor HypB n=1 Tax=Roseiarcus fermentans TaxID=1473586 RepID=A0A366FA27_9HYPH|nr:hydrogenase nickel incorporation protein HypB [Roseiarcus fermentans]RBP10619.1 hydrogenase nickel incorporation protein HypB [Roseiarcus fermentans]